MRWLDDLGVASRDFSADSISILIGRANKISEHFFLRPLQIRIARGIDRLGLVLVSPIRPLLVQHAL